MRKAIVLLLLGAVPAVSWARSAPKRDSVPTWENIQGQAQFAAPEELQESLKEFLAAGVDDAHAAEARFALAESLFQSGKAEEAEALFENLAGEKGSDFAFDSWLRLAEIEYNRGEFSKARGTFEKLADKAAGSLIGAEALYGVALCQMQGSDFRRAAVTVDYLNSKYPAYASLPKTRELLGILRYQERNYGKAVTALEDVATPSAALYRGMSYFYQKQYQEAAQAFNNLTEMPSAVYAEMGLYLKAEAFRMVQNWGLTAKAYGDFVARFPDSRFATQARIDQARALNNSGQGAKALEILQALDLRRESKEIRVNALSLEAEIAAQQGDYQKARLLPEKARRLLGKEQTESFARIHMVLAYYLLGIDKTDEATAQMKELVSEFPLHPAGNAAHILFARAAYDENDPRKAIASYETAFLKYEYSPLSDVALAMMLAAYLKAGQYRELVTQANSLMSMVAVQFTGEDLFWKAQSQMMIAEAYYRLNLYPDASRFYELALKEPKLADQARLSLAWSRYHESKFADSLALAKDILGRRDLPKDYRISAQLVLAGSYFNQGSYDGALTAFKAFRLTYPTNPHVPECWLYEGWSHKQLGAYADALERWGRLIVAYPNAPEAQQAQIQVGLLYFQAHKYPEATKEFGAFLKRWPGSKLTPEALWLLAQTYFNARQDAEAIATYRAFMARYPGHEYAASADNQLMLAYYRQATKAKSPELLAEFVRMYPKSGQAPEAQFELGQIAFQRKDWPAAIDSFRKLLLQYPLVSQAPLSLLAIAQAQERLKKPKEALGEYKSVKELFPTHPAALDAAMRLGALYFAREDYKNAAEGYRFVLERDAPAEIKAGAAFNLGLCYRKLRRDTEALAAFEKFLEDYPKDPKRPDAVLEIAGIERALEKPDKAIAAYERLLEDPAAASTIRMEVCSQLGELYKSLGRKDKSIEAYRRLMALTPRDQDERLLGLAQLAAAYEEQELWDKALEVYGDIGTSGGRADWVRTAQKRAKEIREYRREKAAAEPAGVSRRDLASRNKETN